MQMSHVMKICWMEKCTGGMLTLIEVIMNSLQKNDSLYYSSLTDHHTSIKECQQHRCCKHNMYSWRYSQPKSIIKSLSKFEMSSGNLDQLSFSVKWNQVSEEFLPYPYSFWISKGWNSVSCKSLSEENFVTLKRSKQWI